jgi:L,D-transpeptidase YcbB
MGGLPQAPDPDRPIRVDLQQPVPVYLTYFTAAAGPNGIAFRADPYRRDEPVLARYFGPAAVASRI